MSKPISAAKSFAEWRRNPKYREAYEALESEFSFAAALIQSLSEACDHAEGKPNSVRVHVIEVPEPALPKNRTSGSDRKSE